MPGIIGNVRDAQQSPLFDTFAFPITTALAARITFFDVHTQSANGMQVTNNPRAGALPTPQRFSVFGLSITPIGVAAADYTSFKTNYAARFLLDGKTMMEGGPEVFQPVDNNNGLAGCFNLGPEYGIPIEAGAPYSVELNGTSFGPTQAGALRVYLLGIWEKVVR